MSKLHDDVTQLIIDQIEKGSIPWVKPWNASSESDKNLLTQKPYQGINRLLLGISGMNYSSKTWATYKQWEQIGGQVRKGEKGTQIVFYQPKAKGTVKDESGNETELFYRLLKGYYVFNAEQVDGIEISKPIVDIKPFDEIAHCEQFIKKTGAVIKHGGDSAFYAPSVDIVQLPHKHTFDNQASYYATAFHELTHWTGSKTRLDRNLEKGRFGNPAYAFEELVAELGAAFLCQENRINGELRHAGYIDSWLKCLKDHKTAIFKASALAQTAADYLLALDNEEMPLVA